MEGEARKVSVVFDGGVGMAKVDSQGRFVWYSGLWYPSRDPNVLDKVIRDYIRRHPNAKVVEDGGRAYMEVFNGLMLPPTYQ